MTQKTTADDLLSVLALDELPTDTKIQKDYGFDRCHTASDMSNLLGVYKTLLVNIGVKPKTLDEWMKQGKKDLAANIREKLELKSHRVHKPLLLWFYQAKHIWNAPEPQEKAAAAEPSTAQAKSED
ncbi:uncharacterized protein ColSpa_07907 [Colletotrichum spaethianum]|uniref:Uncharacterized protein n=1 Tax=Colletotrichum spaethianum TaxID=700344 RepID=A0AA37P8R7_9PEZI|nr:uncharacterized protein ColSpa_07907 [Colletotrichum spaethianum]GKT47726.1 hypothetical protein ColSpa_07907 [Colletotrichum spaethianum]